MHGQKIWEVFEIKILGEHHDLNVQSDNLLLADVFENFRNKSIEIYDLDPAHFSTGPGLAWQACLKKTGVKLELLTDIDVLMMVEKGIKSGICQAIHWYAKANNKYMKNYDKCIQSSYLMYLDANNLYRWTMSQRFPVNGFKWVKNFSKSNERFRKNFDENRNKGCFLKVDVGYPKSLFSLNKSFAFLPERAKSENVRSLFAAYKRNKNMLFT